MIKSQCRRGTRLKFAEKKNPGFCKVWSLILLQAITNLTLIGGANASGPKTRMLDAKIIAARFIANNKLH